MDRPLSTAEVSRLLGLASGASASWCAPVCAGRRATGGATRSRSRTSSCCARRRRCSSARARCARIRRAVAALARELPEGRSLSGLRIFADGRDVAVRDGRRALAARDRPDPARLRGGRASQRWSSGISRGAAQGAPRRDPRRAGAREPSSAGSGSRTTTRRPRRDAYRRALELDPDAGRRVREPRPARATRAATRARPRGSTTSRSSAAPTTRCSTSTSPSRSRTAAAPRPRSRTTSARSRSIPSSPTRTTTWRASASRRVAAPTRSVTTRLQAPRRVHVERRRRRLRTTCAGELHYASQGLSAIRPGGLAGLAAFPRDASPAPPPSPSSARNGRMCSASASAANPTARGLQWESSRRRSCRAGSAGTRSSRR